MSDREEKLSAESGNDEEDEDKELTLDELGVVFGGWHPAPPAPDPPNPPRSGNES